MTIDELMEFIDQADESVIVVRIGDEVSMFCPGELEEAAELLYAAMELTADKLQNVMGMN
jgi:hypothetical protein